MEGKPLEIWARVALCEKQGRFYLYEDREDGYGYAHDLKPEGFDNREKAEEYTCRRDRLKWETRKNGLD